MSHFSSAWVACACCMVNNSGAQPHFDNMAEFTNARSSAEFDPNILNREAKRAIKKAFDNLPGSKYDLVLEKSLLSSLEVVCGMSFLKQQGVAQFYELSNRAPMPQEGRVLVYMCNSSVDVMSNIAQQIDHLRQHSPQVETSSTGVVAYVFVRPLGDAIFDLIAEREGVYGLIERRDLPIHAFTMDDDTWSMGDSGSLAATYIHGVTDCVSTTAAALNVIAQHFGPALQTDYLGELAKAAVEQLQKIQALPPSEAAGRRATKPMFDRLIVVDRSVDMVTPLCTQLTYAGLASEAFKVADGQCHLPSETTVADGKSKVLFNVARDEVFADLRDVNFSRIGAVVKKHAAASKQGMDQASLTDLKAMRALVDKLPQLQQQRSALAAHLDLSMLIMDTKSNDVLEQVMEAEAAIVSGIDYDVGVKTIKELLCRQYDKRSVLRLMLLLRLCHTKLSDSTWDELRRRFMQAYNYTHVLAFMQLEEAGFVKGGPFNALWREVRRLSDVAKDPVDGDAAHQGLYGLKPILAKVITQLLSDVPDNLLLRKLGAGELPSKTIKSPTADTTPGARPLILLTVLGGMTYAEMSAVRRVAKDSHVDIQFLVSETITGNDLVEAVLQPVPLASPV
eukprot:m.179962 g.179962  ORF g.179962 m.179962 type:complete len:621 (-) comp16848_c0_seq22:393-2255(-)